MSLSDRGKAVNADKPHLIVDLTIYPTEHGGRISPIVSGFICPCTIQSEEGSGWIGYSGSPQLGDTPMKPGETRRVGYVFLVGKEAVEYFRGSNKFYLLEGKVIGEAAIVGETNSD